MTTVHPPWPRGETKLIGTCLGPFDNRQMIIEVPPRGLPKSLTWRFVDGSELVYARIGQTNLYRFKSAKTDGDSIAVWWDKLCPA